VVAAHSHSSVLYMHRDLPVYVSQLYTSPQFHTYNMSREKKVERLNEFNVVQYNSGEATAQ
jgi:hypothetical protein